MIFLDNKDGLYDETEDVFIAYDNIERIISNPLDETLIITKDGKEFSDWEKDVDTSLSLIERLDNLYDIIVKYNISYKNNSYEEYDSYVNKEELDDYIERWINDLGYKMKDIVRSKMGYEYEIDYPVREEGGCVAVCVRLFKDGNLMDPLIFDELFDKEWDASDVFYYAPIADLYEWDYLTRSAKYAICDIKEFVLDDIEEECHRYMSLKD